MRWQRFAPDNAARAESAAIILARKRDITDGASQNAVRPMPYFPRARRRAVRAPALLRRRVRLMSRQTTRKGLMTGAKALWRRCTTRQQSHPYAFGVWQGRARRGLVRINRTGKPLASASVFRHADNFTERHP